MGTTDIPGFGNIGWGTGGIGGSRGGGSIGWEVGGGGGRFSPPGPASHGGRWRPTSTGRAAAAAPTGGGGGGGDEAPTYIHTWGVWV